MDSVKDVEGNWHLQTIIEEEQVQALSAQVSHKSLPDNARQGLSGASRTNLNMSNLNSQGSNASNQNELR